MGKLTENVGLSKMKNISDFFAQIPFLNEQARSGKVNSLLNSAMGWIGKAPTDTSSTGTMDIESIMNSLMKESGTSTTKTSSPSPLSSIFGSLGGIANMLGGSGLFGSSNNLGQGSGQSEFQMGSPNNTDTWSYLGNNPFFK
jgi:hypothetical protein